MTIFKGTRHGRSPVVVETTVPPPDIVDTAEGTLLEVQARNRHAVHLVERALCRQSLLIRDDRDDELVNLCLDLRATLRPAPVES